MQWTEVTILTTTEGADAMAQALFSFGVSGVAIEDPADIALYARPSDEWDYIDESVLAHRDGVVRVKGYLPGDEGETIAAIRRETARIARRSTDDIDFGSGEVAVKTVADEDWSENWKQYYHAFNVGKKLAVVPSWEVADAPGRTVVRLEPGAAFGSGQHETTFLCLEMAERIVKTGDRVLDIGCGTGILGVAAVALGAAHATLVDRDEIAVSAAAHNAELNGVSDRVDVKAGNLADDVQGHFEIIFANIVADAVIALMPQARRFLAPGGALIASGIITEREQDVLYAARHNGLLAAERSQRGEWVALMLVCGEA